MKKIRNIVITLFVLTYGFAFHYESLRHFYLNPIFNKDLPKIKLLFPPAGWIMFYNVGSQYGHTEVYGVKNNVNQKIDPHEIFRVRTLGYDNIHRGILGVVTYRQKAPLFCAYLKKRFDYFDEFLVVSNYYPSFVEEPFNQKQFVQYKCTD